MSLFSDDMLINEPIFKSEFDSGKKAKISSWTPCEKRLKTCLIYTGSKEIIAGALLKEIHKHSPNAKYFFDLFGGGGAMSVQALASGLKVYYNELKTDLCLMFEYIKDCIAHPRNEWGIFDKEMYFWVDKNEFFNIKEKYENKEHLKGAEIIKSFIYSFGAKGINASYAFGARQWKHAGHNMIFYPFLKDEFEKRGEGLKWCVEIFNKEFTKHYDNLDSEEREFSAFVLTNFMFGDFGSWIERRAFFSSFVITLEALCIARLQKNWKYEFKQETSARALKEFSNSKLCKIISLKRPDLVATAKKYKQKRGGETIMAFNNLRAFSQTQQLEQLQRLEQLQQLEQQPAFLNLEISNKSYADFDFTQICENLGCDKSEIIIYADPPYLRTQKQNIAFGYHKSGFDHKAFVEWAKKLKEQGFNVFISESDGFAEFSGLTPIWHKTKNKGNSRTKKR
nr:MAG TPA_asm: DNA adenine methylase [Caudoviricetes sp.]